MTEAGGGNGAGAASLLWKADALPSRSLPHNLPLQTAAAIVGGKLLMELSHDAFRVHTKGRSWMERHHRPMHKR